MEDHVIMLQRLLLKSEAIMSNHRKSQGNTKHTVQKKIQTPNPKCSATPKKDFSRINPTQRYALYLLTIFAVISLTFVAPAAADYYVRAGAGGNGSGSDWSNAFSALPSSLVRGQTYWVADGSYGSYTFDDSQSGSTYITVRKATVADHGTDSGWSSSYGEGIASFGKIDFVSGYYIIDGNKSPGYGFTVINAASAQNIGIGYKVNMIINNITLKSVSVDCGGRAGARAILIHGSTNVTMDNIELANCDNDLLSMELAHQTTLKNSYLHTRKNAGVGTHGDAFEIWGCDDFVMENNRIDWDGQQVFWGGYSRANNNGKFFGNTFYGGNTSGKGLHANSSALFSGRFEIFNNTFANLNICTDWANKADFRNNIFYGCNTRPNVGSSHSYNYYEPGFGPTESTKQEGGNPFVNFAGENFQLAEATNAGDASIGTTFKTDPEGYTRGADGNWDRGAYEYASGGSGGGSSSPPPDPEPVPVDLVAPRNLRIVGNEMPVISVTASSDDGNVASNTLDDSLATRWSAYGDGQWIEYDMGADKCLSAIDIAFYLGDQRTASFSLETSSDRTHWTQIFSGNSSGSTLQQETYKLPAGTNARYLRIVGHGNSSGGWNSITEVDVLECTQ